jgi:hypothetical protein
MSKCQPTQIAAARKLAQDILVTQQDADMLSPVVRTNFRRTITKMVYGIDKEEAASEQLPTRGGDPHGVRRGM